jgi:hypothetical protein
MTTWVAAIIKARIENCKDSQEFSRQLVEAALCKYAQQTGQHYELHFICGLHRFIRSGGFWHANFLARPKDAAGELPICFFAKATVFTGEGDEFLEEDIVFCCPIKPSTVGMYALSLSLPPLYYGILISSGYYLQLAACHFPLGKGLQLNASQQKSEK